MAADRRGRTGADPLTWRLFGVLRHRCEADRRLVISALDAHGHKAGGERVAVCRAAIERFKAETGDPVSKRRYERWRSELGDRSGVPSATFITNSFADTWAKAMDGLGESVEVRHRDRRLRSLSRGPSDEQALAHIAAAAESIGRDWVRLSDYRSWAERHARAHDSIETVILSGHTFTRRFGSWARACWLAGLSDPPSRRGPKTRAGEFSRAELTGFRRAADGAKGRAGPILQREYLDWRRQRVREAERAGRWDPVPHVTVLRRVFGSWGEALLAAGLVGERLGASFARGHGARMSNRQIAEALLDAREELGAAMSIPRYERWRELRIAQSQRPRPPSRRLAVERLGMRWTELQGLLERARDSENPCEFLLARLKAVRGHE